MTWPGLLFYDLSQRLDADDHKSLTFLIFHFNLSENDKIDNVMKLLYGLEGQKTENQGQMAAAGIRL